MKYKFKCYKCKKEVVAPVSGLEGEEHMHCPNCGAIRIPGEFFASDWRILLLAPVAVLVMFGFFVIMVFSDAVHWVLGKD